MLARLRLVTAAILFIAGTASAQVATEINFGIISTESTQNLKKAWTPLLEDLSKRTGIRTNAFFASDYAGIIEGMRFGKVQVAWFGNKSAMEAVDRASGEVFVQTITDDGSPGYWSLLVVHKDSPIRTLQDVLGSAKSLTLGYGDPNSTSGFLVPGYYAFALNNVDPRTAFKLMRTANHETNLLAVANRQVDVATNNNENLERLRKTNPAKAAEVREVWRSPLIPSDPLVWRKDLGADAKAKLKGFFVAYGSGPDAAREQEVLKNLGLGGFKASDDRQLLPIRQLELFREKRRVESDAALSPADRATRVAAIDKRLADLNEQMAAAR